MSIVSRLEKLGAARDGAILVASGVYFVGYATWMIYAWQHGLGGVRALDVQYFAIGLPAALLSAFAVFLVARGRQILSGSTRGFRSSPLPIRIAVGALVWGVMIAAPLQDEIWPRLLPIHIEAPLAATALIATILFFPPLSDDDTGRPHWLARLLFSMTVMLIVAASLMLYVIVVYARIPQSFGGGRTRRARIEVKMSEVSPSLAAELGMSGSSGGVARSQELSVLAIPGDSLLLLVRDSSGETQRVEVSRDAVVAVIWRD